LVYLHPQLGCQWRSLLLVVVAAEVFQSLGAALAAVVLVGLSHTPIPYPLAEKWGGSLGLLAKAGPAMLALLGLDKTQLLRVFHLTIQHLVAALEAVKMEAMVKVETVLQAVAPTANQVAITLAMLYTGIKATMVVTTGMLALVVVVAQAQALLLMADPLQFIGSVTGEWGFYGLTVITTLAGVAVAVMHNLTLAETEAVALQDNPGRQTLEAAVVVAIPIQALAGQGCLFSAIKANPRAPGAIRIKLKAGHSTNSRLADLLPLNWRGFSHPFFGRESMKVGALISALHHAVCLACPGFLD
jgi:hypothetical protein